jgi:hypothetical protein
MTVAKTVRITLRVRVSRFTEATPHAFDCLQEAREVRDRVLNLLAFREALIQQCGFPRLMQLAGAAACLDNISFFLSLIRD